MLFGLGEEGTHVGGLLVRALLLRRPGRQGKITSTTRVSTIKPAAPQLLDRRACPGLRRYTGCDCYTCSVANCLASAPRAYCRASVFCARVKCWTSAGVMLLASWLTTAARLKSSQCLASCLISSHRAGQDYGVEVVHFQVHVYLAPALHLGFQRGHYVFVIGFSELAGYAKNQQIMGGISNDGKYEKGSKKVKKEGQAYGPPLVHTPHSISKLLV